MGFRGCGREWRIRSRLASCALRCVIVLSGLRLTTHCTQIVLVWAEDGEEFHIGNLCPAALAVIVVTPTANGMYRLKIRKQADV